MNSSNVLQLLAHDIKHPAVMDFFAQHKLQYIECSGERGQFEYQNPDKTLRLTFWGCSALSFRERCMRPVIGCHGKELERWEDNGHIFFKIRYYPGCREELPFALSFDMDEIAITQTIQTSPIEIIPPSTTDKYFISFWVHHIKYHRAPYLLDVAYRDKQVYWFEIALTDRGDIEQFNLQAQYPGCQEARQEKQFAQPAYHRALDASGLACPMPLLKAKLELAQLNSGEVLKVTATDAASQRDFHSFARLAGHQLLLETQTDGAWHYWLRKG